MTFSLPATTDPLPCVVIIGADAVLDARPATPVQLAHACLAAGYVAAIPASWGDELVASACLRRVATIGDEPAIFCACPRVRERLLASGEELIPWIISLVAPPVAAARYIRSLFPDGGVRITYVGGCPGAADEAIDERAEPTMFLSALAGRDIVAGNQPTLFDSVLPPDRRRHQSLPGGLPAPERLHAGARGREVVELTGPQFVTELAQHLLARTRVLLDVAPPLGCLCSGAISGAPPASARAALTALEPPRAARPVVDERTEIQVDSPMHVAPPSVVVAATDPDTSAASRDDGGGEGATPRLDDLQVRARLEPRSGASGRRYSPSTVPRYTGAIKPLARDVEGRSVPRAYAALRRSTPNQNRRLRLSDVERALIVSSEMPSPQRTPAKEPERAATVDTALPTPPRTIEAVPFTPMRRVATPAYLIAGAVTLLGIGVVAGRCFAAF